METTSASIINCSPPTSLTTSSNFITTKHYFTSLKTPKKHNLSLSVVVLPITTFPRTHLSFISHCSSSHTQNPSPELGLLLEIDGVLIDAYRSGNRQAFNAAFRKLGLDCANWTEPVYSDLVRKNAKDEERMLIMYFNRIGWPTSLPTSEQGTFVKSVLREKKNALDEYMMSQDLPLRPGVGDFIDDAYREGVPVVILTSYCRSGDKIASSIMEKLGEQRISKVKVVGTNEVEQSLYSQILLARVNSGVDEELAKEARKAVAAEKQRIAKEVASTLKLSVDINTISSESMEKIVAALRAGAEFAGLPVDKCILVAGSQSGLDGSKIIGMPCIVLRSSLTARGEYPSAKAVMDGFGGGDLTVSKLLRKQSS